MDKMQTQLEAFIEAERIAAQVRAMCVAAGISEEVLDSLPVFDWRVA